MAAASRGVSEQVRIWGRNEARLREVTGAGVDAVVSTDEVLDALSKEGRGQLELVGRALERLDGGDYGTCEDCQGDVGQARLESLPYAITCVNCARKREATPV